MLTDLLPVEALQRIGVTGKDELRESIAYSTPQLWYQSCQSGRHLALFLVKVGFDHATVTAPLFDALEEPLLKIEAKKFVGCFMTPEAAHNLVHFLCVTVEGTSGMRCGCETDAAVADVLRNMFEWTAVEVKWEQALETVPV